MIHNRIEYGDMQLIGEVYDIMKHGLKLRNNKMAVISEEWNKNELDCYLINITTKILVKIDAATAKGRVLNHVLDRTGMEGTGR